MNTTTRTIDPELMNLHGELSPVAPFEDLTRYSLTSIAPMALSKDATDASLPPLPMERTSRLARRAAAVSFIALAALSGVNLGMKLAAWTGPAAMPTAAPATMELAREPAAAAAATQTAAIEQSAPREHAAAETVFVLPTVEIIGSLRQAREGATMRGQDHEDAAKEAIAKDDAKDAVARDDAAKDDAAKDDTAKDDTAKDDARDTVAKDDAPPSDFATPNDARAALAELPGDLDRAAAAIAIASAARSAASCLEAGDGSTTMPVRVTFAPSGRVTSAVIAGGPFVGSPVGGCIAGALRTAGVGAFTGSAVTVTTTIRVR